MAKKKLIKTKPKKKSKKRTSTEKLVPGDLIIVNPGQLVTFTILVCGPLSLSSYRFKVTNVELPQTEVFSFTAEKRENSFIQGSTEGIYDLNMIELLPPDSQDPGAWLPGVNKHIVIKTAGYEWWYVWGYENPQNYFVRVDVSITNAPAKKRIQRKTSKNSY